MLENYFLGSFNHVDDFVKCMTRCHVVYLCLKLCAMDSIKDTPADYNGQPDYLDNLSQRIVAEVWMYPGREEIDKVVEAKVGRTRWCVCNEEGV